MCHNRYVPVFFYVKQKILLDDPERIIFKEMFDLWMIHEVISGIYDMQIGDFFGCNPAIFTVHTYGHQMFISYFCFGIGPEFERTCTAIEFKFCFARHFESICS